jgi:hypothetical protein
MVQFSNANGHYPNWRKTMPLKKSKSPKAFEANLKEELKTKPKAQALVIAYSVKREAEKKAKAKK